MKKLKAYLTINCIFSGISGLTMLFFWTQLNEVFAISNPYVFPVIGSNLLVFSLFTGFVAAKQLHNRSLVLLISTLDGLWVIGSFGIVFSGLFNLSGTGDALIVIVALFVGFLGYMQFSYARHQ